MDFFDNAVSKAKEALDVACKKTSEVVSTQKQKFDIASLENKRTKDFELLGEIYYNKIKNETVDDKSINELVCAINEKNQKIKELNEEINSLKNKRICPNCGTTIDNYSVYCNACGKKVIIDSEED